MRGNVTVRRGDSPTIGVLLVAVLLIILAGMGMTRSPQVVSNVVIDDVQYSVDVLELFVQERLEQLAQDALVCTTCTGVDLKERMIELRRELHLTNTNFYGKVRSGDFTVAVDEEGFFVVRFEGLWVTAHKGETKVTRTFNGELVLDENGQLVRKVYKQK